MIKQTTLKSNIEFSGSGLHTGKESKLVIKPAETDHGYKFKRVDIENTPVINAIIENVSDTARGTTIEEKGIKICTAEHLLAALWGMGIDNALIEIDSEEVPILDGSAKYYVEKIKETGIIEQENERKIYEINNKLEYKDKENDIELVLYPDDNFNANVLIDYESEVIANQYASIENFENFEKELSNARTFVFLHELEFLVKKGLIKGGDIDNALVIIDRPISKEKLNHLSEIFNKPQLDEVPGKGILNNVELHHQNEPARHKLLDMIGDLALIGYNFKGKIIAKKTGHKSNIEFAKVIKKEIKRLRSKNTAPVFELNKKPVYDINKIKELLPHRPPFLLVDKIIELNENSIIGLKNVTMNEGFFVGHFPEEPVMPGVLQIEAMAQVGGILGLSTVENPDDYATYLMKIESVKYKRKVIPGDTLIFIIEFSAPIRRGIANMSGKAFVGDNLVMEGEIMAQIAKK